MNSRKAIDDLRDSLSAVEDHIRLFHGGRAHAYRSAAVELRKLLCDGNNSLLPRLWGRIRLHPLNAPPDVDDAVIFQKPGFVECDGTGGYRVLGLFDEHRAPMDLSDWLAQPLLSKTVTIREFIRSVADKEGAHSDKNYNATLHLARSVNILNDPIHKSFVIAVAEYIVRVVAPALAKIDSKRAAAADP
jgi:hypothetical protein